MRQTASHNADERGRALGTQRRRPLVPIRSSHCTTSQQRTARRGRRSVQLGAASRVPERPGSKSQLPAAAAVRRTAPDRSTTTAAVIRAVIRRPVPPHNGQSTRPHGGRAPTLAVRFSRPPGGKMGFLTSSASLFNGH